MTEEINYQALYEQLQGENEQLRERISRMLISKYSFETLYKAARDILTNGYFWCGYFVAIVVMLLIGAFRFLKEL
jgi:hypothetical protein